MAPKKATRNQILTTAIEQLSGNPSSSLEVIIGATGVPRATFFRYFKDREELELAVEAHCFERLNHSLQNAKNFEETLRILLLDAPLTRYVFLLRELRYSTSLDPVTAKLEEVLTPLWEAGLIDPNVPMVWVEEVIGSLIYSGWNLARVGKLDHDQVVSLTTRTLFRGLGR
jgi:TetR/AcrR family transcriptional repressor of lfrA